MGRRWLHAKEMATDRQPHKECHRAPFLVQLSSIGRRRFCPWVYIICNEYKNRPTSAATTTTLLFFFMVDANGIDKFVCCRKMVNTVVEQISAKEITAARSKSFFFFVSFGHLEKERLLVLFIFAASSSSTSSLNKANEALLYG